MLQDWAFAQKGQGLIVETARGLIVLEFNEFLGRIASGQISADDVVISHVMTDGHRRRVGDLILYAQVRSGFVRTETMPRRVPGGVLATGLAAQQRLLTVEAGGVESRSPMSLHHTSMVRNLFLGIASIVYLVGFGMLCAVRPGLHGPLHAQPAPRYYPASHPEHPPFLRFNSDMRTKKRSN